EVVEGRLRIAEAHHRPAATRADGAKQDQNAPGVRHRGPDDNIRAELRAMRIPGAVVPALVLAHAVAPAPRAAHTASGRASGAEVIASLVVAGARGCVTRADLIVRIVRRSS